MKRPRWAGAAAKWVKAIVHQFGELLLLVGGLALIIVITRMVAA